VPSLVSAQLIPERPKAGRLWTKVTLKSPSSAYRRWPIPKGLKVVLPLLILQTQLGLSVAKVPTARAMLPLCLSSRVHTS
jgi:hypothetical protein